MTELVLIDTHTLLWLIGDRTKLSAPALSAITEATSVLVSSISFWEVAMLNAKGRISFDRPVSQWTQDVLASDNLAEAPVTALIGLRGGELEGFHGDPADRLIVASAQIHRCPLISKDLRIRDWAGRMGGLECIW